MSDYQFLQAAGVFILLAVGAIVLLWLGGWFDTSHPFRLEDKDEDDENR